MRQTSEVTDTTFPFADDTVAFILVYNTVADDRNRGFEHASTHDKKLALVEDTKAILEENGDNSVTLLAVWPGATRSDVFLVDDLDEALAAF